MFQYWGNKIPVLLNVMVYRMKGLQNIPIAYRETRGRKYDINSKNGMMNVLYMII